jgi:membrane-bound lytic murein transglycosylase F
VSYWLLQLSKQEYYADPVVRFGFCRGLEPVSYVSIILDRFQHYRQFVSPGVAALLEKYRPYLERAAAE